MNWFERLTGFNETSYDETRRKLQVDRGRLRSLVNDRAYGIGTLELVSLQDLRERVQSRPEPISGRLQVRLVTADVRRLHASPDFAGALFQVASQFNLLEMCSPDVTPEQGVTRYEHDPTQGPACAIAAGAATIYRNYFAPVGGRTGQTSTHQLDGLADVGAYLAEILGRSVDDLWTMRNGYALCIRSGLEAIDAWLDAATPDQVDRVRGMLRIGLHRDVEVTDSDDPRPPVVSQAFCSALPAAYSEIESIHWRGFASLVLESAYEATLWAAAASAQRGGSNVVLLTSLGGGAFGNNEEWITSAMRRALRAAANFALDVRLVSHRTPPRAFTELAAEFATANRR
jgi:hypothetical protein